MAGAAFVLAGSPDDIRFSAGKWANFAGTCLDASTDVGRIDLADFRGDEADLHHARLHDDFAPALDVAGMAWSVVASALSRYAGELESFQQKLNGLAPESADENDLSSAPAVAAAAVIRDQHTIAAERCAAAIERATAMCPAAGSSTGSLRGAVPSESHGYGRQDPLFDASSALRTASYSGAVLGARLPGAAGEVVPGLFPVRWATMSTAAIEERAVHIGEIGTAAAASPSRSMTGAALKDAAYKNGPTASSAPPPWVDNAGRHNAARNGAFAQIKNQVAAMGGNPSAVEVETPVPAGAKNKSGNTGFADITYTDSVTDTVYIWEVKGSTNPIGAFAQGLTAAAEVQWYMDALTKRNEHRHVAAGFPMTAPVTTSYLAKDGIAETLTVTQGPGPGAIVYSSDKNQKGPLRVPVPFPVPFPVPIPVPAPIPVPVPIAVPGPDGKPVPVPGAPTAPNPVPALGALAGGGLVWWLAKLASPMCGPAAPVCAVIL